VVPELVLVAPASIMDGLVPMVVLGEPVFWPVEPSGRVRRVLLNVSRSADFRRHYCSMLEASLKYHMSAQTVRGWIHQGKLAAVRVGLGGRLFVDRQELAAFLKTLPKPAPRDGPGSSSTGG
jgi:hypothetical protein